MEKPQNLITLLLTAFELVGKYLLDFEVGVAGPEVDQREEDPILILDVHPYAHLPNFLREKRLPAELPIHSAYVLV